MDHQHRRVAEEQWQYTPSLTERYAHIISEMRSQIRSLENAVEQLQRDIYSNRDKSPAPLGVNLDEVLPPQWLRQGMQISDHTEAPLVRRVFKSKLLLRGSDRQ
jgi:hypothetical protein